ncbi:MAG: amidohydrolase family protein, partial [Planctomycetota bacterium]
RGYLKKGFIADVVVFDPNRVIDHATWSEPHQYPSGIPYVMVNGKLIIDQEKFSGQLAGKVLRVS